MPRRQYVESALRHVVDVWLRFFDEGKLYDAGLEDAICAAMFNLEGLLFEVLKGRNVKDVEPKPAPQAWIGQGPAPNTATEALRESARLMPMPSFRSPRPGLHPRYLCPLGSAS
jgi:hypothetical protein